MARKLTLDDIVDMRAYERERDEFRSRIIELKERRRVSVGPILTLTFENRETVRFQVQEMVRAERMLRDEQIEEELRTYNPLIPDPGTLSATLFVELQSEADLREWLPKLVGIERSIELRIGEGANADAVRSEVEASHAAQLTREEITASVHYIDFRLSDSQVERFASEPAALASIHPSYQQETRLSDETKAELLRDLRGED